MKIKKPQRFSIALDKFNSQIFDLKMGNIFPNASLLLEEDLKYVRFQKTFDHLSIKISADNKCLLNQFLKEGFYLVDTQVTYKVDVFPKNRKQSKHVRKATPNDFSSVSKISETSFKIDRFHSDINLDCKKANIYYSTWAQNLLMNESIMTYVYEKNNKIYGFSSWEINNNNASLILVAVSEDYRGKGVYKSMLNHFFYCHSEEIISATTGTQINNFPVHNFWGKIGACLIEAKYVLHKKY